MVGQRHIPNTTTTQTYQGTIHRHFTLITFTTIHFLSLTRGLLHYITLTISNAVPTTTTTWAIATLLRAAQFSDAAQRIHLNQPVQDRSFSVDVHFFDANGRRYYARTNILVFRPGDPFSPGMPRPTGEYRIRGWTFFRWFAHSPLSSRRRGAFRIVPFSL